MRKITQKEFESFERVEFGVLNLPTADYTEIKNFPEWCR
jgi:hypothetical protein